MKLNALIATYRQEKLTLLESERAGIEMQLSEYEMHNDPEEARRAENKCQNAARSMDIIAKGVQSNLSNLAEFAHEQKQSLRAVQVETGVYRQSQIPDKLATTASLVLCGTVEAAFTTITVVADGTADFISGGATGVTTTIVTIGLGACSGYSSRWLDYGLQKSTQTVSDRFRRKLAITLCTSGTFVAGAMSFAAARVRTVGSHRGIFDFSEVGFLETFNDGLSLTTMAIGGLTFLIALKKGRSGFVDKVPALAEIASNSSNDTDADARFTVEDALLDIDDLRDDAEDVHLVSTPMAEEESILRARIIKFKASVQSAKEACRAFNQQECKRESFIEGRNLGNSALDTSCFDRLIEGLELKPRNRPNEDVLEILRAAHSEATATIMQAHADYLANVQGYRVPPPNHSTAQ